jgi:hypothetical protein
VQRTTLQRLLDEFSLVLGGLDQSQSFSQHVACPTASSLNRGGPVRPASAYLLPMQAIYRHPRSGASPYRPGAVDCGLQAIRR